MIPAFNDSGYLPSGVHPATLDEIEARFGTESELRQAQMESLRWLADLVGRAGVLRVVINGSFVTDIIEPNDVDCALLIDDSFPRDHSAGRELLDGLPFLDINLVMQADFDILTGRFFANDRMLVPKGMVEVIL